ncbi:thiamine pyrophosphate-binding protein [Polaromonas sp. C04]|uniref:thiamine pyrophosphate-binding protein n=1 Tax=Polaromonas sp. C04 TaxID=1945857 RepID=UPI0009841295|nr:thiamine pyrophosphate-binding protein [Polaromonas sp. C04]OOG58102.1 thiamine pyrophosphate-binding protein [Polaromonas sp. C04]
MNPTKTLSPPTAGRVLVDSLRLHGVDRVFCVPGESYLEVLDALYDVSDQIQLVVAKHEGGAANMAEADGKLTGRPGICMVTRGPGATQASVGVHTAQQDSTPMILFVGQIATDQAGRDVFQEVDYVSMFGKLAKWVVEVTDASRMAEIIARAFHTAVSGRPGPVVVALPEDVLVTPSSTPAYRSTRLESAEPSAKSMAKVRAMLAAASRPLLMVGGSGWSDDATKDIANFAARWNIPVACTFRRQDIFDNRLPQYAGHLSLGMNVALSDRLKNADVVLAVGTRITDVATDGYSLLKAPNPDQALIHFHPEAHEIGRVYRPELGFEADVAASALSLAALSPPENREWDGWTASAREAYLIFSALPAPDAQATGVDLASAMRHARMVLPSDAIVTNGAGNYSVWLHRFFEYRQPRTELAPTCGAMGYGLPAAIAAALRNPERKVVCVAGDGCFLMYPQELATASQYGARLIVLVVNNGMYGTIRMHQEKHYPKRISGTQLKGPDYVALAKAFGAHAERVSETEDFAAAFSRANAHDGLALIELVTDPRQITPSMRLN